MIFKKTSKTALAVTLKMFLLFIFACHSQQPVHAHKLYPFMEYKKWGYLNQSGKITIQPKYDYASPFKGTLAIVKLGDKYGYVSINGDEIVSPKYYKARPFIADRAAVYWNGKWGYINKNGEYSIKPEYDEAWDFNDGLAPVSKNGKYGYINTSGEVVIDFKYKRAYGFSDGCASVELFDNKCEAIDMQGNVVIDPIYDSVGRFLNGLFLVENSGVKKYVDREEKTILKVGKEIQFAGLFYEGLAKVHNSSEPFGVFSCWGYMDMSGNLVIDHQFSDAQEFNEGLAAVNISRTFSERFDDSGRYIGTMMDGQWGYIRKNGSMAIAPQFDEAYPFNDGLAQVLIGDRAGYINKKGKLLWNLASKPKSIPTAKGN